LLKLLVVILPLFGSNDFLILPFRSITSSYKTDPTAEQFPKLDIEHRLILPLGKIEDFEAWFFPWRCLWRYDGQVFPWII